MYTVYIHVSYLPLISNHFVTHARSGAESMSRRILLVEDNAAERAACLAVLSPHFDVLTVDGCAAAMATLTHANQVRDPPTARGCKLRRRFSESVHHAGSWTGVKSAYTAALPRTQARSHQIGSWFWMTGRCGSLLRVGPNSSGDRHAGRMSGRPTHNAWPVAEPPPAKGVSWTDSGVSHHRWSLAFRSFGTQSWWKYLRAL